MSAEVSIPVQRTASDMRMVKFATECADLSFAALYMLEQELTNEEIACDGHACRETREALNIISQTITEHAAKEVAIVPSLNIGKENKQLSVPYAAHLLLAS